MESQIINQFKKLVEIRAPLDIQWSECYQFSYPYRGQEFKTSGSVDGIANAITASNDQAVLFDTTATDSVRLLSSSLLSSLTPPSSQWFSLALSNVDFQQIPRDGQEWLEESATRIFQNIHASNYDSVALEFFTDVAIGGMVGLYIEMREGKFFFELWPLATLYCQDTLGSGFIDTVYRRCPFTAAEAIQKFKTVPQYIQEEFEKDAHSSKKFGFIHTIRPRLGKKSRGRLKSQMLFESVYVCEKTGTIVSDSGYHEFPVVIPRWMSIPNTDYAFGPLKDALPDVKTVNKVTEFMLMNAEMAVAGMFLAVDDGMFNPNTQRVGPRSIWMVQDVNNIKPLSSGGDINFAVNEIVRLQGHIRRTLLADQLGPSEKANMTAAEVNTRTNLIRQILGPIFGRLQAEFLVPLITRCFGVSLRNGDLGEPPESIRGQIFNITYRSPLAKAQRLQDLDAMDQFENRLLNRAQFSPEVFDLYDSDLATRKNAELLGVEVELMREQEEVDQLRKERAKAQAEQAQAQAQAEAQQSQQAPDQSQQDAAMQEMLG